MRITDFWTSWEDRYESMYLPASAVAYVVLNRNARRRPQQAEVSERI